MFECLKLFSFCEELSLRVLVGSRMFGIIFIFLWIWKQILFVGNI